MVIQMERAHALTKLVGYLAFSLQTSILDATVTPNFLLCTTWQLILSVTIYGNDTKPNEICSADLVEIAQPPPTCYNASWVYFSIDECTPLNSTSATSLPSAAFPSSPIATFSSTTAAIASASSMQEAASDHRTRTILGGGFGGIAAILLLVALFSLGYYIRRRRKRHISTSKKQIKAIETSGTVELEGQHGRVVAEAPSNIISELPGTENSRI